MRPTLSPLQSKEVGRTWEKNATQHKSLQPQYIKKYNWNFFRATKKFQLQIVSTYKIT